jgi:hypothetical protein
MAQAEVKTLSVAEVRAIAEHLCREGVTPSGNSVVAYCQANHLPISKRTALKRLKELGEEGVTFTPAASGLTTTLDPGEYEVCPAVDPVAQAEQALKQAELLFQDARDVLLHAKLQLLACQGLSVQGVLHGSLHPQDEIHQHAAEEVDEAKRHYDAAWQTREQARAQLNQAVKTYQRSQQEQWVARHRPELVQNMHVWGERLRTATSDYMHAKAKKNHSLLRFAYEQAVAQAPVNGTAL